LVSRAGIAGTPAYMAPEQWEAEALDIRTDIYALGAILYEMLTGQLLYQATTIDGLRSQHLSAPIPKLPDVHFLPGPLTQVITRCLAKRKEERFATVDDLLQALSQIYQREFAQPPRNIAVRGEFTTVDYNNRGYTYYTLRRYEDALADYNRAIALEPNSAKAYANRGVVYEKMRRYTEGRPHTRP
jgi:serine/threonine protein kinase